MKKALVIVFVVLGVMISIMLSACGGQTEEVGIETFEAKLVSLETSSYEKFFSSIEGLKKNSIGQSVESLNPKIWTVGFNNPYYHANFIIAEKSTSIMLSFPKESNIIDEVWFFIPVDNYDNYIQIVDAAKSKHGKPVEFNDNIASWDDLDIKYLDSSDALVVIHDPN